MPSDLWLPSSERDAPCLRANLEALRVNQPDLAERLAKPAREEGGRAGVARGEGFSWADGRREITHNPSALRSMMHLFEQGKWLIIHFGMDLNGGAAEIAAYLEQRHPGEPKGVLIIEPEQELLRTVFHLHDLSAALHSGRLLFATGPGLEDRISELWREHRLGVLDAQQMGMTTANPQIRSEAGLLRNRLIQAHQREREEYFALLRECEAYWSRPKAKIERVWTHLNDARAGGLMAQSLALGFADLGLAARALYLADRLFTRFYRCAVDFFSFRPDLILSLNHSSNYTASFAEPVPIPRLVWYVDQPERTAQKPYHRLDRCVGLSESFRGEVERRGGVFLGEVPAAAPHERHEPTRETAWRHEISYVGSVIDHGPILEALSPGARGWVDAICEAQVAAPLRELSAILRENPLPSARAELVPLLRHRLSKGRYMDDVALVEYFLYAEANSRRRVEMLTALGDFTGLGIYGPADWLRLLQGEKLRGLYRGPIDSSAELGDLYRASKINLSINSLQGFGFINPRAFEVPAMGGFLLAEWTPGIERYFVYGEEMIWFKGIDDLRELIADALDDDERRLGLIERAQRRIQREHRYAHRARTMLNLLESGGARL